MSSCPRCGTFIPSKSKGQPGRARIWCSENCRKRALDDEKRAVCEDCGTVLGTGSGFNGANKPKTCRKCLHKRVGTARRAQVEAVAAMYNEGLTMREIAKELGYGPRSIPGVQLREARRLGLITTYRYKAYEEALNG